jgi:hypothetical protein
MDNEYLRKWIELYGNPMYSGEAEIYGNPNVVGAAASHTQLFPQGLLNLGGGVDYIPRAEDKLIPYGFAEYKNPTGLNLKGMIDEYSKSLSGQYGNVGANITKSDGMTEMSARALANILGGEASLDAYKNPYDKGLMFNFTKTF